MISVEGAFQVGDIEAHVFEGQRPPESYAKRVAEKIISAAEGTHPVIKDQANDYRQRIQGVVAEYIRLAVLEERDYCAQVAKEGGSTPIAEAIRRR